MSSSSLSNYFAQRRQKLVGANTNVNTNTSLVAKIEVEHPIISYSGLTIVIDNPSRFDAVRLLSGYAGTDFEGGILPLARQSIEIRTSNYNATHPFREGTRVVGLLGDKAARPYLQAGVSLSEIRGTPLSVPEHKDKLFLCSFFPQDTRDFAPYEAKYNPLDEDFAQDDIEDDEGKEVKGESGEKATHGKTLRKNWRFWLLRDLNKLARWTLHGKFIYYANETSKQPYEHIIYPNAETVVSVLTATKRSFLYLDIETDSQQNLTCIGFSFGDGRVFVVPFLRYDYTLSYCCTGKILRAFAIALRDNVAVIHNSNFDLFVLAYKYRIPLPRFIYDTMNSHWRLFTGVEKSLGHCISLYTDLPYHKNEGVFSPHNNLQEEQLWRYNAKDVEALVWIKKAQDELCKINPGLRASVEQVNKMVYPYLVTTLTGMRVDLDRITKTIETNDRRCTQLLRILRILTGRLLNPQSPKQVAAYLYNQVPNGLGIKKPAKFLTNEKTLRKILLKQECPAIQVILELRHILKQSSKCKFTRWERCYERQIIGATIAQNSLA